MKNKLEILIINHGYNQSMMAEKLGIDRKAFWYQLKNYHNRHITFYQQIAKILQMPTKKLLQELELI